jgi:hypothetical protein
VAAVTLGLAIAALVPAIALAHPLGNFTINHYAGIRVEPDRVLLDVVVDQAEIPTFQARLGFDTDGDGEVSDDEADAGRIAECDSLTPSPSVSKPRRAWNVGISAWSTTTSRSTRSGSTRIPA